MARSTFAENICVRVIIVVSIKSHCFIVNPVKFRQKNGYLKPHMQTLPTERKI